MRQVYREQLEGTMEGLAQLSELVVTAITDASAGFSTADVHTAETVISADADIDARQNSLDEDIIRLLALQGPVAGDLRTLVAALRISASLERMGDLARHIGQLTRLRYPATVIPEPLVTVFAEMADLDQAIARDLHRLLTTRDLDLADRIEGHNRRINDLHASVFRTIADPGWNHPAWQAVDVSLASRYLERFADHAVSCAAKVRYLVTGQW